MIANVTDDMQIAQEEIFGPVITTTHLPRRGRGRRDRRRHDHGLSGFVSSTDQERARAIARRMRTGMVHLHGAGLDFAGALATTGSRATARVHRLGLRELPEIKSISGTAPVSRTGRVGSPHGRAHQSRSGAHRRGVLLQDPPGSRGSSTAVGAGLSVGGWGLGSWRSVHPYWNGF
ncbi:aldehyde dehydrogenase family protein [Pseudonocardia kujensis]|uniref:aldehyde dehydrogenase family protein n=1 Tax=Pseudonocardia kujensis TaxID=1128675 RepID=UPI003558EE0A